MKSRLLKAKRNKIVQNKIVQKVRRVQGNLLRHWGDQAGPGYQWPSSNHGITIDYNGNVWIGGNGAGDGHVLKFTQDGKFIMQVGKKGVTADSNSTEHFYMVAKLFVDAKTNEVYVSDGYGNKPDDMNMGRYNPTDPPIQQFRNPVHCAELSNDNLVYVCDRVNDRIQVFTREGKFIKETWV